MYSSCEAPQPSSIKKGRNKLCTSHLTAWLWLFKGSIALSTGAYPVDSVIIFPNVLIRWLVIYLVDNAIQRLNNQGQASNSFKTAQKSSNRYGYSLNFLREHFSFFLRLLLFTRACLSFYTLMIRIWSSPTLHGQNSQEKMPKQ